MSSSFFLAKLFGWYFIIMATLFFFRRDVIVHACQSFLSNTGLLLMAGILSTIAGIAILVGHPVFGLQWQSAITLIGALSLFKGIVLLGFPRKAFDWHLKFFQRTLWLNWSTGVMTLLGLAFLLLGYSH